MNDSNVKKSRKDTEGFKVCFSKEGSVSEAGGSAGSGERPQRLESLSQLAERLGLCHCYLYILRQFSGNKGGHAFHYLHHGQEDHLNQGLLRLPPMV